MFVDEKKVGEQQADSRSDLERFIAWAKTQDPNSTYDYSNPRTCLIARWDKSEGRNELLRHSFDIEALFDGRGWKIAQYGGASIDGLRTVGTALGIALRIQGEK